MNTIQITKADGTREPFDNSKLVASLDRAGASKKMIDEIVGDVHTALHDGITTREIYRHAFKLLKKKEQTSASRYSMRRAVLALGPTGFPFEDFVAEMFKKKGYTTRTRQRVKGKCAPHELDLIASNEKECIYAEVKFHNQPGAKSDLKTALYVQARFDDLRGKEPGIPGFCPITNGLLITNTKFTKNVSEYGKCAGLDLISWNYPATGNLQDLIEETGIQPISALTTLSEAEKRSLMEQNIVLCRSLSERSGELDKLGIKSSKQGKVLDEIKRLCG